MRVFTGSLFALVQLGVVVPLPAAAQSPPATVIHPAFVMENRVSAADATSWRTRVLTALGGAVVGAGIGFFTSQVFTGDWDEEPGRYQVDRSLWAAVGGSVGLVVGFTVPISGTGRPAAVRAPGLRGGRYAIAADEISGKGVKTAYEAVEVLRPEWLITRGTHVLYETPDDRIDVYLDEMRLGGTQSLREINAETVAAIHFLDPGSATIRFGGGHSHGVILVIAKGGISRDAR